MTQLEGPNDTQRAPDSLAPGGQLVAPWGPAQLGLDGRAYAPPSASGAAFVDGTGGGEAPASEARSAESGLGPCTSFPARALPGQLPLPLDQWDRQHAMWSLMDNRATVQTEHRRMGKCGKVRMVVAQDVGLERLESGAWRTTGLVQCNTWQCPTCGPRRARERAALIGAAIAKHRRASSYADAWLLTFTIWHLPTETQKEKIARLFAAWETFNKDRRWRRFRERWGIVDVVRCFDETFGSRGVHPHFHVVLFPHRSVVGFEPLRALPVDERNAYLFDVAQEQVLGAWEDAVRATGVFPSTPGAFRQHAVDLRGGEDAAAYVVKWGLADEAVRSPHKRDSHTDLLNRAAAGDAAAGALFRAWADATRGRNFCTGTGKLRERLELSDEDIAAHVDELRRRRDVERARAGIAPEPPRPPLRVSIARELMGAVIRVGWGPVIREVAAAELRGDDVQLALERYLWRVGGERDASAWSVRNRGEPRAATGLPAVSRGSPSTAPPPAPA